MSFAGFDLGWLSDARPLFLNRLTQEGKGRKKGENTPG